MAKPNLELGSAELEVLKVLWEKGPSPVRDVLEIMHKNGRRVAYTTVLTILTRLEQKGMVASDRSEQAYVYRAKLSRQRVTTARLQALVRDLYDGAAATLVLEVVQSGKFSPEEISQLHRLIEDLDAGGR
ncbi:MAG: BlaI/MecI/CopY family transcriptional regulator [Phycisphaerales bacterium]|nr:BlaI/MecI/CopY family transcriptional regulator [Phycisphaerales bacterium]